ncbi:MAG: phosphodiesterase [Spirochaetaceae bacterium]|nr:phosphodiesterase [Spirochaetaceae bacterium]
MKFLIASDIHGSYYYANKLINIYQNSKFDKILLLGDILYHGPRNDLPKDYAPKKVIELLNPLAKEILCVKGNCEAEVDQMVLDFDVSSDHALLLADNRTFYLAHGHHKYPTLHEGDIFLSGHTHLPLIETMENNVFHVNPGSTSIPKGGFNNSYAIYEDSLISILDFEGNIIYSKDLSK